MTRSNPVSTPEGWLLSQWKIYTRFLLRRTVLIPIEKHLCSPNTPTVSAVNSREHKEYLQQGTYCFSPWTVQDYKYTVLSMNGSGTLRRAVGVISNLVTRKLALVYIENAAILLSFPSAHIFEVPLTVNLLKRFSYLRIRWRAIFDQRYRSRWFCGTTGMAGICFEHDFCNKKIESSNKRRQELLFAWPQQLVLKVSAEHWNNRDKTDPKTTRESSERVGHVDWWRRGCKGKTSCPTSTTACIRSPVCRWSHYAKYRLVEVQVALFCFRSS